ncbi:MAG: hypothetical protein V3U10_01870, partial [Bacteroidota bacterium]
FTSKKKSTNIICGPDNQIATPHQSIFIPLAGAMRIVSDRPRAEHRRASGSDLIEVHPHQMKFSGRPALTVLDLL